MPEPPWAQRPLPVDVELLGPWADAACGNRWHTVRVTSDSRVVWAGPPRAGARTDVLRFVEELLNRDVVELAGRYAPLGEPVSVRPALPSRGAPPCCAARLTSPERSPAGVR